MANDFTAFHETLLAGAAEYNESKKGRTALLDCVYKDIKPEAARVGKTVDVYFPDVSPMSAIDNGQLTSESVSPNYIPLVFQKRIGKALQFQDFEQWQTATDISEKFFKPLYNRAAEYLNGQIAALINTTNFNSNAPIIGATRQEVKVADQLAAWDALADQKVPLEDRESLNLLVHNNVYRTMMGDSEWMQESIVGATIAAAVRNDAKIEHAFNFTPRWDQQMPCSTGTVVYGQVAVTNGSTAVTGLNTAFTTDLTTAHKIIFGNDPTRTAYGISSIASNEALTLSGAYSGATATTTARKVTVLAGTVAIATTGVVTGTSTAFTTALSVGDWITVAGDTNTGAKYYQIATISSNTAATVVTAPAIAISTAAATVYSYTNLALHKYAIALALRPIATPPQAAKAVDVSYVDVQGIPLRVIVSWQHTYQALFVTVDFGYALGVIRPDFGVIIKT